jgi:hypothetical protein
MLVKPLAEVLGRLSRSKFRSGIQLRERERAYLAAKGIQVVLSHALDFIAARLAPAEPLKDGKQTPWRGHPVFVAQHATATCCRSCLEKWHSIPRGRDLTGDEKSYVVEIIGAWLSTQTSCSNVPNNDRDSERISALQEPEFSFERDPA